MQAADTGAMGTTHHTAVHCCCMQYAGLCCHSTVDMAGPADVCAANSRRLTSLLARECTEHHQRAAACQTPLSVYQLLIWPGAKQCPLLGTHNTSPSSHVPPNSLTVSVPTSLHLRRCALDGLLHGGLSPSQLIAVSRNPSGAAARAVKAQGVEVRTQATSYRHSSLQHDVGIWPVKLYCSARIQFASMQLNNSKAGFVSTSTSGTTHHCHQYCSSPQR